MGINLAKQLRSNIVIGTDPDADRMGVAIKDNNGEFVLLSGNQIGAMMMNYILMRRKDMGILPASMSLSHMHAVLTEPEKDTGSSGTSSRWL